MVYWLEFDEKTVVPYLFDLNYSYYLGIIRPHEPTPEVIEPRHRHHFGS